MRDSGINAMTPAKTGGFTRWQAVCLSRLSHIMFGLRVRTVDWLLAICRIKEPSGLRLRLA